MTMFIDIAVAILFVAGGFFFTAGTIGIFRFPDLRSQLHALTKADNLGLGLIFAAVALHLGSWSTALILLLVWLLALIAASVSARVLAGTEPAPADETRRGT